MDSTWEVDIARCLDDNDIKWERPKTGIKYVNIRTKTYYPDFYLADYNISRS